MKKVKLNKNSILIGSITVLLISIIIIVLIFFKFDALTNSLNKGLPIKILFSVADKSDLEFLELFIYSPVTKKAGIYHVPANLGTKLISQNKVAAIGTVFKQNDISKLLAEVESVTGTDIEFSISMQVNKFIQLIDLVEGVELFISNPIDFVYNEKRILIPSGNVVLDGDKALDYMLYEDPNEELRESIYRKQKVFQALFKRFGDETMNAELLNPNSFPYFKDFLTTDISSQDLRAFLQEMREFDSEHIIFQRVEGKITEVDKNPLLFPYFEGDIVKRSIKQIFDTIDSNELFDGGALDVTIEILNGTEINGLASKTAVLFTQLGFDVVNVMNGEKNDYEKTIVQDRWGKKETATEIANIIKCKLIETRVDAGLENVPQITIILGADFDGRYCKE